MGEKTRIGSEGKKKSDKAEAGRPVNIEIYSSTTWVDEILLKAKRLKLIEIWEIQVSLHDSTGLISRAMSGAGETGWRL